MSKTKQPDTVLSILNEIHQTIQKTRVFLYDRSRRHESDMYFRWFTDEEIDEWNIRALDQETNTEKEVRGYYHLPSMDHPLAAENRKLYDGQRFCKEAKCWPVFTTDFLRVVDRKLMSLTSKLIGLEYPLPERWKPIGAARYFNRNREARDAAWDELRFLIQKSQVEAKQATEIEVDPAESPVLAEPEQDITRDSLDDVEKDLIDALGDETLVRAKLIARTGRKETGATTGPLTDLAKRKILGKATRGYYMQPRFKYLQDRDKSRDKSRD